jgi:hypothetical protein
MAQLILTDEERAAPHYLDWDDEALGMAARKLAMQFKDVHGVDGMFITVAARLLVGMADDANSDKTTIDLEGFTKEGEERGDWRIVITRTKAAK